ncbi:hypothetical protein K438DRAFT_1936688 [Mycena galopus ATCC 62051]|nr:hypothetical protein K438DRAFT_1936688 [Mycena galopus ATCC 62051]
MSIAINQVPAVMLPTEILAEIFMRCLPEHSHILQSYVVDESRILCPSDAPLLVASVCRRWREVAISTHQLWRFALQRRSTKDNDSQGVVASWLSRSLGSFTMMTYLPRIVQELNRHCEQWRAVELFIPTCDLFLFDAVRRRLPCLTKLCLILELGFPYVSESFAEAPQLKEVYLIADSAESVVLPWHQLTKLTCESFTDIECVAALRRCPAIVDCSFAVRNLKQSMESITSLSPLVHGCITSLQIRGTSNLDIIRLLTLPSLRVLRLECACFPDNDVEILVSFLARSGCYLESLCLWFGNDQTLLRSLPFLASLITLKIRTCEVFLTEDILHLLKDHAVFPNLRRLDMDIDLQDWQAHDWTDGLMREMILSRCLASGNSPGVPLETFRLVYQPNGDDTDDEDEDATGLMVLASELHPLLASRMVEFEISPNSTLVSPAFRLNIYGYMSGVAQCFSINSEPHSTSLHDFVSQSGTLGRANTSVSVYGYPVVIHAYPFGIDSGFHLSLAQDSSFRYTGSRRARLHNLLTLTALNWSKLSTILFNRSLQERVFDLRYIVVRRIRMAVLHAFALLASAFEQTLSLG